MGVTGHQSPQTGAVGQGHHYLAAGLNLVLYLSDIENIHIWEGNEFNSDCFMKTQKNEH